jgi:CubicO group peptidase (beta-lactamase class C family)
MNGTRELLASWIGSGELLGAYVFVSHHGRPVADLAVGDRSPGRPAQPSDVGRLYCGVKPFVAVCVAKAVQDGLVELTTPVHEILDVPDTGRWRSVDLRGLLSHTSGLWPAHDNPYLLPFDAFVARILRGRQRWAAQPMYNTVDAWHLLAAVAETVVGASIDAQVRAVVGAGTVCLTQPSAADFASLHVRAPHASFRELADAPARDLFSRPNPAHGGFARNHDVGRFYSDLLACRSGDGAMLTPGTVAELTRRHAILYEGSRQEHRWGLGVEVAVAPRYFGVEWGTGSFGHTGAIGDLGQGPPRAFAVALADPASGLVLSVRLASVDARSAWRLARIGRALTADLADYL